jgi:hypothetical protein
MRTTVLGTPYADTWSTALRRLPQSDVYHLPEYHRVAEANGEGLARAFVAEAQGELFLHAFLLRPIERVGGEELPGRWADIETVYGYSGPLASTDDPGFLAGAWAAFDAWAAQERVVAEFVRFNPLLENERLAPRDAEVRADRETVVLPLDLTEDELWASYPSVQRNMVRKAQAAGLTAGPTELADGLARFRRLYADTMDRVGADPYYDFGEAYFPALEALGERVRLFEARRGEEVAAAALFLVSPPYIHYHLSGGDPRFRSLSPTNLLLHSAASWGREHDFELLHLGGGRTPADDDSLLRFKSSVSRARRTFYTGRRVHDKGMYRELCARWVRQAEVETPPPYFLLYRLEVPR